MSRAALAYLILGLGLLPLPLLSVLHVESAAVVALAAFFVSGWSALAAFERGAGPGRVLGRQEALLAIPWLCLTASLLWQPNCAYLAGVGVYLLFPVVTVVLAVAVAFALHAAGWRRPRWLLGALGVGIALGGPIYDLGFHAQFYTYNHVFGGVLGPIYDEQLAFRPGLFVFRGLSLLWAALVFLVGWRLRGAASPVVRAGIPLVGLAIGAVYFFSAPLGLNTPAWHVKEQLGGHVRTAHVDLYYDAGAMGRADAEALAREHEAEYERLTHTLQLTPAEAPRRIQSFVYPHPDAKARLTGARMTSVAPVWLRTPQMHMLRTRAARSLDHEMAHLFARPFGLPVLNASWAVGLVEGWAVAFEAPESGPTPDDLVRTAAAADTSRRLTDRADALAARLSPLGFWTGRSAVSYNTMGSFVRFLRARYGPAPLKAVYATAQFEAVYGVPLDTLAHAWAGHLRRQASVHRGAEAVVAARFTRPSLFEADCPHYVPPYRRRLQDAERALRQRDTVRAVAALEEALAREPRALAAHIQLASIRLSRGEAHAVRRHLDTLAAARRHPAAQGLRADAHALLGDTSAARRMYADLVRSLPVEAREARVWAMLRAAIADRPDALRVLVRPDSAVQEARRLAALTPQTPALRAWQALRWHQAHEPVRAARLWASAEAPLRAGRPPLWQRTWALQRRIWQAEAALGAGAFGDARRHATAAARLAGQYGDNGTADRLRLLRNRAVAPEAPNL